MEWIDSIEELVDYHDDDDEVEVDDDNNNNIMDIGKGRSYDCVFCKRGFNTAQALGGHMNIHRKDRAKTNTTIIKPNSTISTTTTTTKQADDQDIYSCPPFYQPISGYYPWYSAAAHGAPIHNNSHLSYNISPASTNSIHNQLQGSIGSTIPFRGDPCMGQFGTANFSQELVAKRRNQREDDGLDLELRLGYYP